MIKKFIKQLLPDNILRFRSYLKNKYYGYTFWENFNKESDLIDKLKVVSYLDKRQHNQSLKNFLKFDKNKINFDLRNSMLPIHLLLLPNQYQILCSNCYLYFCY